MNQDVMFLYEIEVDEKYRRKGTGTKLIDELKAVCRRENVLKMWVMTNRSNEEEMNLYRKSGGVDIKSLINEEIPR